MADGNGSDGLSVTLTRYHPRLFLRVCDVLVGFLNLFCKFVFSRRLGLRLCPGPRVHFDAVIEFAGPVPSRTQPIMRSLPNRYHVRRSDLEHIALFVQQQHDFLTGLDPIQFFERRTELYFPFSAALRDLQSAFRTGSSKYGA